jgi:hypothetical protein
VGLMRDSVAEAQRQPVVYVAYDMSRGLSGWPAGQSGAEHMFCVPKMLRFICARFVIFFL